MLDRTTFPDALSHYRKYGYALVRGVFSRAETVDLAAAFDRHWAEDMAHPSSFRHGNLLYRLGIDPKLGKVVRLLQWPSYADPALERVRRDPRMFEILEPLLGRDIKQIINQLHWKPPGAASADFAFHQDVRFRRPPGAYRNLATSYVQTGIAVDRHSPANGATLVVPGSHGLGELVIPGPERILDGSPETAALEAAGRLSLRSREPGDLLPLPAPGARSSGSGSAHPRGEQSPLWPTIIAGLLSGESMTIFLEVPFEWRGPIPRPSRDLVAV
jgi:Phytanoyl-CoA dioxygenase (PhyH)